MKKQKMDYLTGFKAGYKRIGFCPPLVTVFRFFLLILASILNIGSPSLECAELLDHEKLIYPKPIQPRVQKISSPLSQEKQKVTPQLALQRLLEGNSRYVNDALEYPNRTMVRRQAILLKQAPFAVIVGCADSRVSPEIVFDQGLGDLFVVRVAGNVIGPIELDSIEYATLYLNSSVVLVMGHESCAAVDAVIHEKTKDIESVAELIQPAVQDAKKMSPQNLLETSIKINAVRMRDFLMRSPVIQKLVKDKKLEVYPAYYNLKTGEVEILTQ